jgi:hypothetical protein
VFKQYLDLIAKDPETKKARAPSEQEIQSFENEVGVRLPLDYKDLLKRFGAGVFRFGRFRPLTPKLPEAFSLDHAWIKSGQVFVFAKDYGGNLYLFDCRTKSDNPPVLFLDHERVDESNPHLIYHSFADFISDQYGVDSKGKPTLQRKEFAVIIRDISRLKPGTWVQVPQLKAWDLQLKVLSSEIIPEPEAPAWRPKQVPPDPARTFCFALYQPDNLTRFIIDPFGRHGSSPLLFVFHETKMYTGGADPKLLNCSFTGQIERKVEASDPNLSFPVFFLVCDQPIPESAELELKFEVAKRTPA